MSAQIDLDAIHDVLAAGFADRAASYDAADRFVAENYTALREARVFSALIPTEFGGGGADHAEMCRFLRRIGRACPSTALALSMHQHLVAAAVANWTAGRAGSALLEKVAEGERICVSTGANDWLSSNGTVERVSGGYRVTAMKPFASGSPMGDILITSAAYDDPEEGALVLHFPVPISSEGVSGMDNWMAMGMRGSGSQTMRLDGVFVPEEAVVLRRPRGTFHPAFAVILTVAMPLVMSAYLGVADAAAEASHEAARGQRDKPDVQTLAGELGNRVTAAEIAVESMIDLARGYSFTPDTTQASKVLTRKALAAKALIGAGETALQLAGGGAFLRTGPIERYLRDLHGAQFHPLPEARQKLFCGRLALGLDPVGEAQVAPLETVA